MHLEELDSEKLLVLMGMGGIFALVGLYLLMRPRATEGETRIEIFGLKFNASSAGLVVFLMGAIFLAVPVFVRERAERPVAGAGEPTTSPTPSSGPTAIVLPAGANAGEQEPNNSLQKANQLERGSFYAASINPERNDAIDWFVVPTIDIVNADVKIQIRTLESNNIGVFGRCVIAAFNDKEIKLKEWNLPSLSASEYQNIFIDQSEYLLLKVFSSQGAFCKYELKVI